MKYENAQNVFLDFFQKKFIYANVSLELKQKWFQNKNLPA